MSLKLYARFTADLGHTGGREYSGIVELDEQDRREIHPAILRARIARDLSLDANAVQVLHWSRLH
jgi:hypothetical protein